MFEDHDVEDKGGDAIAERVARPAQVEGRRTDDSRRMESNASRSVGDGVIYAGIG